MSGTKYFSQLLIWYIGCCDLCIIKVVWILGSLTAKVSWFKMIA